MALTFSNELMQAMGFREFADDEAIVASFTSVTVYEARGVSLAPGTTSVSNGSVANLDYRLAVSASVNDGCIALTDDTFTENEDEWKKENKCLGPFVMVLLGPTVEHTCETGRIKIEDDGSATTYDCFPSVRIELNQFESRALPPIVSALTCVFNEDARYVALRKIERASVGRTRNGVVLHDMRMEMRADMYTSYNLPHLGLAEKLNVATNLASTLNPKASRFFALGVAEEDQLKRFLYFFLSLEVETHAVYGRIDHASALKKLFEGALLQRQSTTQLLQTQVDRIKSLYDRFLWCAACAWTELDESDIAQFKSLKRARDDIAHGTASEPPLGFARLAELLAHKVLWCTK